MQQWLIALAGPALAVVGYLGKRWLEGRCRGEVLKRRLQALALHQGMERTGLSLKELDQLGEDS